MSDRWTCWRCRTPAKFHSKSELEGRILYACSRSRRRAECANRVPRRVRLPPGSLAFPDVLYLAQKLRTLLGSGRALAPQDMTTPETNAADAGGVVNIADLQARAKAAVQNLNTNINLLTTAAAGLPAAPDPVRAALIQCSFYGVASAIPNTTSGADPNLATQAASVLAILQARYTKASAVNIATAQVADLEGIFESIFGSDFVVLPLFTPPNLATLQSAFSQSAALVSTDSQAPSRWFRQLTHVRPGISRLDMALSAGAGVERRHRILISAVSAAGAGSATGHCTRSLAGLATGSSEHAATRARGIRLRDARRSRHAEFLRRSDRG